MSALIVEGYVIVSADGMLANADHVMPDSLKFEGDKHFFTAALDRADLIVHGRHSFEDQPNSPRRKRIAVTRAVDAIAPDPDNRNTCLWNPAGATLEEACAAVDFAGGTLAIAGGTEVFSLFLKIGYDIFYLARAEQVRLPGGVPVFCQGRFGQSPEDVLRDAGLKPTESRWLDNELSLVKWTA